MATSASRPETTGAWLAIAQAAGDTDSEGLALWAMRYSPLVSVCRHTRLERCGVVVEVAGSAHLFGGLDKLLDDARDQVAAIAPDSHCAGAPTAAGAWALACCGTPAGWADPSDWPAVIDCLPLTALDLPATDHTLLTETGLHSLGECRSLPRGDLARRCQSQIGQRLDQITGAAPEPRQWFRPPEHYDRTTELLHETWQSDTLLFVARRLVAELEGLLRGSGRAVQTLRLALGHAAGRSDTLLEDTRLELALTRPLQGLSPVAALLRERLSRLRLPAPVRRVRLAATPLDAWQAQTPELWPGPAEAALQRSALLDRLRARLGDASVCSLQTTADHRPEGAWGSVPASLPPGRRRSSVMPHSRGLRPLWLLPQPEPLAGIPSDWQEERGPERIEAGWWEGPVARDYFVLRDGRGRRVWAFRTQLGQWFAHGWFA